MSKTCQCNLTECGSAGDILSRLKNTKDPLVLSDIVQSIDRYETANLVIPCIPTLLNNRSWVLRADVLELIARANFRHYKNKILAILKKDPNIHVKSYAMMAYYDLFGKESIPVVRKYVNYKNTILRSTALCLLYVATKKKECIEGLNLIVSRKNCWRPTRYAVYNTLSHYLELKKHPELIGLLEIILAAYDPKGGIAKELKITIRQMKAAKRDNNTYKGNLR